MTSSSHVDAYMNLIEKKLQHIIETSHEVEENNSSGINNNNINNADHVGVASIASFNFNDRVSMQVTLRSLFVRLVGSLIPRLVPSMLPEVLIAPSCTIDVALTLLMLG